MVGIGCWSGDERGMVEMPLKLMVSAIIMAATASAGFKALSTYSESAVESGLRQQAEALAAAAFRLDSMGLNSSALLELRLEGAPLAHVEYFRAGFALTRPLHPYSAMVRFKGSGTDEGHVYVRGAGGGLLPMCSSDGDPLELGSGVHRLLMTRLYSEPLELVYIQLEVVK